MLQNDLYNDTTQVFSCKWDNCSDSFSSDVDLVKHIYDAHLHMNDSFWRSRSAQSVGLSCKWENCFYLHAFNSLEKLIEHMRLHTCEEPFVCGASHCGKQFSNVESLILHLQMAHSEKIDEFKVDIDQVLDLADSECFDLAEPVSCGRDVESSYPSISEADPLPAAESVKTELLPPRPVEPPETVPLSRSSSVNSSLSRKSASSKQEMLSTVKQKEKTIAKYVKGAIEMRKMLKGYIAYIAKAKRDISRLDKAYLAAVPDSMLQKSVVNKQVSKTFSDDLEVKLSSINEQVEMLYEEIHSQILPMWRIKLQSIVLSSSADEAAQLPMWSHTNSSSQISINPDLESPGPLLLTVSGSEQSDSSVLSIPGSRRSYRTKSNSTFKALASHRHLLQDDSSLEDVSFEEDL